MNLGDNVELNSLFGRNKRGNVAKLGDGVDTHLPIERDELKQLKSRIDVLQEVGINCCLFQTAVLSLSYLISSCESTWYFVIEKPLCFAVSFIL